MLFLLLLLLDAFLKMAPSPSSLTIKDELKQTFDYDAIANSATDIETAPSIKNSSDGEKPLEGSADPTAEAELQYVTGIKLYLAVASVSLAIFLMLLDISIIATVSRHMSSLEKLLNLQAIPLITDQFHSLQDVGWYGSTYLLARYGFARTCSNFCPTNLPDYSCATQPLTGKVYTNFNIKVSAVPASCSHC